MKTAHLRSPLCARFPTTLPDDEPETKVNGPVNEPVSIPRSAGRKARNWKRLIVCTGNDATDFSFTFVSRPDSTRCST